MKKPGKNNGNIVTSGKNIVMFVKQKMNLNNQLK